MQCQHGSGRDHTSRAPRESTHVGLMLDNYPIFGGEAKENEFEVGGGRVIGPQGSFGRVQP